MNREILFRGKREDNGEWVEGFYVNIGKTCPYIATGKLAIERNKLAPEMHKVIPETVGQYTGLTDRYGNKIFEGDIVTVQGFAARDFFYSRLVVEFIKGCFYCVFYGKSRIYRELLKDINTNSNFVLDGNIHDNPELVRKDEENGEV